MNASIIPHVWMLSFGDQILFRCLHDSLSSQENRYNRHRRLLTLQTSLGGILSFCRRGDNNDWLRCFVCGVLWIEPWALAVNTRQLGCVLGKSKSSVNGGLAKMNWAPSPMTREANEKLCQAIPYLQHHPDALRQWTIRRPVEAPVPPAEEIRFTSDESGDEALSMELAFWRSSDGSEKV
jgi:hypothetical protein